MKLLGENISCQNNDIFLKRVLLFVFMHAVSITDRLT